MSASRLHRWILDQRAWQAAPSGPASILTPEKQEEEINLISTRIEDALHAAMAVLNEYHQYFNREATLRLFCFYNCQDICQIEGNEFEATRWVDSPEMQITLVKRIREIAAQFRDARNRLFGMAPLSEAKKICSQIEEPFIIQQSKLFNPKVKEALHGLKKQIVKYQRFEEGLDRKIEDIDSSMSEREPCAKSLRDHLWTEKMQLNQKRQLLAVQ